MAARIAILRPYAMLPSEGGANDRYVNLCEKLAALGAEPELYCSDFIHNAKQRRMASAIALNAQRLPYLRQVRSIAYRSNLSPARIAHEAWFGLQVFWRLARGPRPDVVLVGEPLFAVGWIALLYGLLFRVPVLADLIDLWPEADTAIRHGFSGALRKAAYVALAASRGLRLRGYAAVSYVSRAYADRLAPGAPVFYWGSELAPRHPRAPSQDRLVAIYAGSLGLGYDISTLLEAAAILHRQGAPLRVVIAGSGPRLAEVRRAQSESVIDYLGQLGQAELTLAYESADIGLLPYQSGSMVAMPIKFFDYVNFGLAIASSLAMEARDLIEEKGLGVSYEAGDAKDLADKLIGLSANRAAIERARAACGALAKEFSVDAQYERFARFVLGYVRAPRRLS